MHQLAELCLLKGPEVIRIFIRLIVGLAAMDDALRKKFLSGKSSRCEMELIERVPPEPNFIQLGISPVLCGLWCFD